MKNPFFLLAAALLFPVLGASAQSFVTAADGQLLAGLPTAPTAATNSHVHTRSIAGGGSITYFETTNSRDAHDEQFAQLRQAFEASNPTVVLYEGTSWGTDSTAAATISHMGTPGYVRYLAQQRQVPAASLDSKAAEYEYLYGETDAEQFKLYYLMCEIRCFQQRTHASKALTMKGMESLIASCHYHFAGTEMVIRNLSELQTAYHQYYPEGGKWWKSSVTEFDATAPSVGNSFAANFHRDRAAFRARYQASQLAEHAQAGQRIFVVVTPGHIPS